MENSHPDGEPVGHLVENDALQAVGDVAVDFNAAVDRAGMHDQTLWFQKFCALFGQAEQTNVFAEAGKIFSALTFVLDPQKLYDIGLGQHLLNLVRNFDAQFFKLTRNERAWSDQRDVCAELKQPEDIRARDAAKENVTDDRDVQPGDFPSAFAHRVKIQKRLGRMFMRTIAGIDHARFESTCQKLRSARGTMTQY